MPDPVPVSRHLDGLRAGLVAFARYAEQAGLDAPVPTCPEWRVRDLVAHQGMVHRWATARVTDEEIDTDAVEAEGLHAPDPVEWLRDGAVALAQALHDAPEDLAGTVFLANAPSPRTFWARRQCHETTIHAVDALAAALGRYPQPSETWVTPEVAMDGLDELLTGFLPRSRSRLRSEEPYTLLVLPEDDSADRSWLVRVGSEAPRVERRAGAPAESRSGEPEADARWRGSAVALYLALWNRGDEVRTETRSASVDPWPAWRAAGIRWG